MLAPVSESFVDLSYRGLPLGRRIKLTQVRPSSGYLELATPMPVGTAIVITTDEGVSLDATVTHVFEQIGGTDRVPGMTVAPALAEDPGAAWWKARVALPDLASKTEQPAPPPRSRPLTVRPRSATTQPPPGEAAGAPAAPAPAAAPAAPAPAPRPQPAEIQREPELVDDGKKTVMMSAVTVDAEPTDPHAEAPILDDGKKTVMMHSVDLSALGLEPGASGEPAAGDDDDDGDGEDADEPEARAGANGDPRGPVPAPPTGVGDKKPFGKKRKKRR